MTFDPTFIGWPTLTGQDAPLRRKVGSRRRSNIAPPLTTAGAGTVASALRFVAKAVLVGDAANASDFAVRPQNGSDQPGRVQVAVDEINSRS